MHLTSKLQARITFRFYPSGVDAILQHEMIATSGALLDSGEVAHLATDVSPPDPFGWDVCHQKRFCNAKFRLGPKKIVTPQR